MKNKIGWCNMTWNPVWGCLNHCEYCYARIFANRFYKGTAEKEHQYIHKYRINSYIEWKVLENRLKNFKLTFLHSHFDKKFPKKPQRIFVGSMSEIYYWREEWIEMIIEKVKQYPQHTFQFLTKFPRIYYEWAFPPENCWLGITVTGKENKNDMQRVYEFSEDNANLEYHNIKFISFEPLLNSVSLKFTSGIHWVIIGAETGNRKGKIIPKKEWIEDIRYYCKINKIPLYLKDSLKDIYPDKIKEFPKGVKRDESI